MRKLRRAGGADMRGRARALTTLTDLDELEESIASLEVAVEENADLAVALTEQVARTEKAVMRVVARAEKRVDQPVEADEDEGRSGGRRA